MHERSEKVYSDQAKWAEGRFHLSWQTLFSTLKRWVRINKWFALRKLLSAQILPRTKPTERPCELNNHLLYFGKSWFSCGAIRTHHHNRASVVSRHNFNNVDRGSQNTVPQANKNSVGKDGMIGRLLTMAFSICTSSDKSWRSGNFTLKWNYAIFSSPQNDKTLVIRINSKRGQLGKVVSHADCKWDVWRLTRAGDGVNIEKHANIRFLRLLSLCTLKSEVVVQYREPAEVNRLYGGGGGHDQPGEADGEAGQERRSLWPEQNLNRWWYNML